MNKTRIGLFGGSFDPPTKAHLHVAEQLIEQDIVDEIQFVPAYVSYHGKNYNASPRERCQMMNELIHSSCSPMSMRVNTFEIDKRMKLSTYKFIDMFLKFSEGFVKDHNNIEYYFIVGGDNADKVPNFINGKNLIKKIPFVIVNRGTYKKTTDKWYDNEPHTSIDIGDDYNSCSSTKIRDAVARMIDEGLPKEFLSEWCEIGVFAYILNYELYGLENDDEDN